ncbi:hypothetical protein F2P81_020568 [Scophthalmus maximus]|uniref:Uncharacterized protein n=1 Tax=Scophthalmus maximus TaxID=52904 RepID=A0A6A4S465_SCOMX|nr:hypothetical protein F2P81_020568 [Scophthalmus maximus]
MATRPGARRRGPTEEEKDPDVAEQRSCNSSGCGSRALTPARCGSTARPETNCSRKEQESFSVVEPDDDHDDDHDDVRPHSRHAAAAAE